MEHPEIRCRGLLGSRVNLYSSKWGGGSVLTAVKREGETHVLDSCTLLLDEYFSVLP